MTARRLSDVGVAPHPQVHVWRRQSKLLGEDLAHALSPLIGIDQTRADAENSRIVGAFDDPTVEDRSLLDLTPAGKHAHLPCRAN